MDKWIYLAVAIISEVTGTAALKSAEGFTKLWPSCRVVLVLNLFSKSSAH